MSSGQVSRCKKRLGAPFEKLGGKPLILIIKRPSPHGGKPYHEISVVDIWEDNYRYFSLCRSTPTPSSKLAASADEVATSARETKKTLRRKINEERAPSLSPSLRETKRENESELSKFWNFLCTIIGRTDDRGPTRAEQKLMLHWLPIQPEEYKLVRWWMTLDPRGTDVRQGIGFSLLRRPRSVRSLLQDWSNVNDVARSYLKRYERDGHFY